MLQIYAILCHKYMRSCVTNISDPVSNMCDEVSQIYAIYTLTRSFVTNIFMRCVQHIYAILNCMHRAISNICTVNIEDILESNIATVGVPYARGIGL